MQSLRFLGNEILPGTLIASVLTSLSVPAVIG